MGKVVAVANMKGGVGKTATVVMLAEALAAIDGKPVLVIDVDAQANASLCIAGDNKLTQLIEADRTIDAYLDDQLLGAQKIGFTDCVAHQASTVSHRGEPLPISLLASSPELRLLEREIVVALTERKKGFNAIVGHLHRLLDRQIKRSSRTFGYILVDCAPGISALTEATIRLADIVIVPTIPDYLSAAGLQAFCNSFWKGTRWANPVAANSRKPFVLITRRRPTKEHHRHVEMIRNERYKEEPSFVALKTEIPEAAAIAAGLGRDDHPTFTSKWSSDVTPIFEALVKETKEALNAS